METRKNLPLQFELAEKKERSAVRDLFLKKVGAVGKSVSEAAKTGLKGGLVGASAATANGVITGAATAAVGKLAATGIGGVLAATGAGAVALHAAPLIAGFSAACVVGTAVKSIVDGNEK